MTIEGGLVEVPQLTMVEYVRARIKDTYFSHFIFLFPPQKKNKNKTKQNKNKNKANAEVGEKSVGKRRNSQQYHVAIQHKYLAHLGVIHVIRKESSVLYLLWTGIS